MILPLVPGKFYSQVFYKGQSYDQFNIYIRDMFFEIPENIDFAGYADDNTPYTILFKTN